MQFATGKFYKTKSDEKLECIAVWSKPDTRGRQVTMLGDGFVRHYDLEGRMRVDRVVLPELDILREWKDEPLVYIFEVMAEDLKYTSGIYNYHPCVGIDWVGKKVKVTVEEIQ